MSSKSQTPDSMKNLIHDPLFPRRTAMTIVGVLVCGFAVGIFKASSLGVDPFQVFCNGLNAVIPISFGTLYMCINIVLLIAMFFADRHYIGLGTLINLFLLGYVVDFSEQLMHTLFPEPGLAGQFLMLVCAIPILCISSSLYFTADMGVSTYDVWALLLDKRTRFPFRIIRVCTDLFCVGIGFTLMSFRLNGIIGIGTIITAFFMGPLIDLFNRKISRPLLFGRKAS